MFLDRSSIHTSLFGLVGFNNATEPSYPTLVNSLLTSRSGLYYNDAHSLLTIENIDQTTKNFSQYNYSVYSGTTDSNGGYTNGSKVTYNGSNYEYINSTASSGNAPPNATYWRQIDELSDYLIKCVYNGIDRMLDKYMNGKKMRGVSKSILANIIPYQGQTDLADVELNRDRFVGLRIRLKKKEKHIIGIINKIGTFFDAAAADLDIKLYHDSQQDAIATFTVSHATASTFQWNTISSDNILRYVDSYDAGGDFYLGYKQSDLEALSAQALNRNISYESQPLLDGNRWKSSYRELSKYVDITGFSVAESNMTSDKMFNTIYADIEPEKNYGLNLNITMDTDLTPFFTQEESSVSHALKYNVAMVLMEGMAYNMRKGNNLGNTVRVEAEKQLYHHKDTYGTLADRCREANDSLSIDFSDMDNHVMPKDNEGFLKIKSSSV